VFRYPTFDLTIARELDVRCLRWPTRIEVREDAAPGGNRLYADMRHLPWQEAMRVRQLETQLIERIERAEEPEQEIEAIDDELYESDTDLLGLDLGVASTVVALSAARCIPFTSCNAGVFGGGHLEAYPLVGFFLRRQLAHLVLSAAAEADIGLENTDDGAVLAYATHVRQFRMFAEALISRRQLLDAVRLRCMTTRQPRLVKPQQLTLWNASLDD